MPYIELKERLSKKYNVESIIEKSYNKMESAINWYLYSCDTEKVTHEFLQEHFRRSLLESSREE